MSAGGPVVDVVGVAPGSPFWDLTPREIPERFWVTTFDGKDRPHGKEWHSSFDLFREAFLFDPEEWPGEDEATEARRREVKDGLPMWSPAKFKGAHRRNDNHESTHLLVLDYDKEQRAGPEFFDDRFTGRTSWMAHTTLSHTPGRPHWRVVMPLSRPIGRREVKILGMYIRKHPEIFGVVDPCVEDAARGYFLSCRVKGFATAEGGTGALHVDPLLAAADAGLSLVEVAEVDGHPTGEGRFTPMPAAPAWLDEAPPDDYSDLVDEEEEDRGGAAPPSTKVVAVRSPSRGAPALAGVGTDLQRRVEGYVRAILERIRRAPEGTRHDEIRNGALSISSVTAWAASQGVQVISEDEVVTTMCEAFPDKDRTEIARAVRWAWERGASDPRPLTDRPMKFSASLPSHILAGFGETVPPGDLPEDLGEDRPRILVGPRADRTAALAIEALAQHPEVYQRGRDLVRVVQVEDAPVVHPLIAAALPPILSAVADFYKVKAQGRDEVQVEVAPPRDLCAALASGGRFPGVRELRGVSASPMVMPSGEVISEPGYHAGTGVLYMPAPGAEVPMVEDRLPAGEARRRCEEILSPLADFPWKAQADRSAWLALVMTLAARDAWDGPAPMFVASGNQRRVGKTRLVQIAGVVAKGRIPGTPAINDQDAEVRKMIDVALIESHEYVIFDNVQRALGGEALEAVLTATTSTARVLGRSQTVSARVRTVWAATANGARFTGDAAPRSLPIRLSLDTPHPEARAFAEPDIMGHISRNRVRLQAAAISVVASYLRAGAPDQALRPWGSYEAWSRVIRGALVWAGMPDPIGTREGIEVADAGAEGHERFLSLIFYLMGRASFAAGRLADAVEGKGLSAERTFGIDFTQADAVDALEEIGAWDRSARAVNRARLGRRMHEFCDRPTSSGLMLTRVGQDKHQRRPLWAVKG